MNSVIPWVKIGTPITWEKEITPIDSTNGEVSTKANDTYMLPQMTQLNFTPYLKNDWVASAWSQAVSIIKSRDTEMKNYISSIVRWDVDWIEQSEINSILWDNSQDFQEKITNTFIKNPNRVLSLTEMLEKAPYLNDVYPWIKTDKADLSQLYSYKMNQWDRYGITEQEYNKYLQEYESDSWVNNFRKLLSSRVEWNSWLSKIWNVIRWRVNRPSLDEYISDSINWTRDTKFSDLNAFISVLAWTTKPVWTLLELAGKESDWWDTSASTFYTNITNDLFERWILDQDWFDSSAFVTELWITSAATATMWPLLGASTFAWFLSRYPQAANFINKSKYAKRIAQNLGAPVTKWVADANITSLVERWESASLAENIVWVALGWASNVYPRLQRVILWTPEQLKSALKRLPVDTVKEYLDVAKRHVWDISQSSPVSFVKNKINNVFESFSSSIDDIGSQIWSIKWKFSSQKMSPIFALEDLDGNSIIDTPYSYVSNMLEKMWYTIQKEWGQLSVVGKKWKVLTDTSVIPFLNSNIGWQPSFMQQLKTFGDNSTVENMLSLYTYVNTIKREIPASFKGVMSKLSSSIKTQINNQFWPEFADLTSKYAELKWLSTYMKRKMMVTWPQWNLEFKPNAILSIVRPNLSNSDTYKSALSDMFNEMWEDYSDEIITAWFVSQLFNVAADADWRPSVWGITKGVLSRMYDALKQPSAALQYTQWYTKPVAGEVKRWFLRKIINDPSQLTNLLWTIFGND